MTPNPTDRDGLVEALLDAASKPYDMRDVQGRAALMSQAAAALREDAWLPIESAPRDGTEILLFHGPEVYEGKEYPARVTSGAWIEWVERCPEYHSTTGVYLGESVQGGGASWMSWDGGFREESPPTHWRPLPAPPQPSGDGGGG